MADSPRRRPHVVLASGSPRRLELLRRLGVDPEVLVADIDEAPRPGESAPALVGRLAVGKRDVVAAKVDQSSLVVAADTVVVLDGVILGKPESTDDARQMLAALSGRSHAVLSGVAVRCGELAEREVVRTEVQFRTLTAGDIDWYLSMGEAMDKAGAYGIQGAAGVFVTTVTGSESNVIGLPLEQTVSLARRVGVDLLGC